MPSLQTFFINFPFSLSPTSLAFLLITLHDSYRLHRIKKPRTCLLLSDPLSTISFFAFLTMVCL